MFEKIGKTNIGVRGFHARGTQKVLVRAIVEGDQFLWPRIVPLSRFCWKNRCFTRGAPDGKNEKNEENKKERKKKLKNEKMQKQRKTEKHEKKKKNEKIKNG